MAVKVTFDTTNKLIIANTGVTTLDVRVDLYSDAKEDWQSGALDISSIRLNKRKFPYRVIGGDDTAPGEIAPLYAYLKNGWRIRPQEADHVLNITGGAILVDGDTTLDPFVDTLGAFTVRVRFYVPVQGTLMESGTSGLTPAESAALLDLQTDVEYIKGMEKGEWSIVGNQMIFKNESSVEIARFNLFDENGNPSMINVFKRSPV
jgi:hypothetical protein